MTIKRERQNELNRELEEALRGNREDLAWMLSFQMAGNGLGPRKRNHYILLDARPDLQTWTEDLALSGREGGMEAIATTTEEFIGAASAHDYPFYPEMEHWEQAN
eukprot:1132572-Pyramimonas_sp.AAC.1